MPGIDPRPWFLVPARGGSKGIHRKNLRLLGRKPLIRHVVERLSAAFGAARVIVSTEDDEIARATADVATIHPRSESLAEDLTTLDEVAVDVATWLIERGASLKDPLVTVQPTSPLLEIHSIDRALALLDDQFSSVVSVKDDRHLRWTRDEEGHAMPLFSRRVNRQELRPTFAETGGIIAARLEDVVAQGTRIIEPTGLVELSADEAIDIDTPSDWAVAQHFLNRLGIVIRADAANELGTGHIRRAAALASELFAHDVTIVTRSTGDFELGPSILSSTGFRVHPIEAEDDFHELLQTVRPDITILDVLDTSTDYVQLVQSGSGFVVSLEDLGNGARLADLVINDLYADPYPMPNHWTGVRYAILAPHFEGARPSKPVREVERILVSFGGTDPNNLTDLALEAIGLVGFSGEVRVVLGPGYRHGDVDVEAFGLCGTVKRSVQDMAAEMSEVQLAVTSAGRTVTELMHMGVPTVALCQNVRELTHTHASSPFGVMNLGYGPRLDPESVSRQIAIVLEDGKLRESMRRRGLNAVQGRTNSKIVHKIIRAFEATLNS